MLLLLLRLGLSVVVALLAGSSISLAQSDLPATEFKIAFIGDQGSPGAEKPREVLELIASEGADAVVHSGDFDYEDDPAAWDALITEVLGANFPYFASVGNHDDQVFYGPGGYQELLAARMNRLGIPWSGDLGVASVHEYRGMLFVMTAPGVFADGDGDTVYAPYVRDQLSASDAIWRISSWHKNMTDMQVGGKGNETGWGVYEESRRGGAIIATGHEHSYSRTHLLSHMPTKTCFHTPSCESPNNTLVLAADDPQTEADEGASFAFVSGLGGRSVREQEQLPTPPWWASLSTSTQGGTHGALFGEFNLAGDARMARFYFMDIGPDGIVSNDDRVIDDFFVVSTVPEPGPELMGATALLVVAVLRTRRRSSPASA